VHLAWIGFGVGNKLGKRFRGNRGMHLHDVGHAQETCDWRNVANEVEIKIVVKCRIGRVSYGDQEERVAVRGRAHDRLGGDVAATPGPVLDNEWLPEPLR